MILQQRRRHRLVWLAFVLVLPAILIVAWQSRRAPAVMDELPKILRENGRP